MKEFKFVNRNAKPPEILISQDRIKPFIFYVHHTVHPICLFEFIDMSSLNDDDFSTYIEKAKSEISCGGYVIIDNGGKFSIETSIIYSDIDPDLAAQGDEDVAKLLSYTIAKCTDHFVKVYKKGREGILKDMIKPREKYNPNVN